MSSHEDVEKQKEVEKVNCSSSINEPPLRLRCYKNTGDFSVGKFVVLDDSIGNIDDLKMKILKAHDLPLPPADDQEAARTLEDTRLYIVITGEALGNACEFDELGAVHDDEKVVIVPPDEEFKRPPRPYTYVKVVPPQLGDADISNLIDDDLDGETDPLATPEVKAKPKMTRKEKLKEAIKKLDPKIKFVINKLKFGVREFLMRDHKQTVNRINTMKAASRFGRNNRKAKQEQASMVQVKFEEFTFQCYEPVTFHGLRSYWGLKTPHFDFVTSICGQLFEPFVSNSKSGAFFFYTEDRKYMIKTLPKAEVNKFMSMLGPYRDFVIRNPKTLLSRFFGLYGVTGMRGRGHDTYFVVMGSVFSPKFALEMIFDLKGSTFGRQADEKDLKKSFCVYKDKDWINLCMKLKLNKADKKWFLKQTKADSDFLHSCNVIDYSLLLAIADARQGDDASQATSLLPSEHTRIETKQQMAEQQAKIKAKRANKARIPQKTDKGVLSTDDKIYFMGIIDFFIDFGNKKYFESVIKPMMHRSAEVNAMSCVKPDVYADRFQKFMTKAVDYGDASG